VYGDPSAGPRRQLVVITCGGILGVIGLGTTLPPMRSALYRSSGYSFHSSGCSRYRAASGGGRLLSSNVTARITAVGGKSQSVRFRVLARQSKALFRCLAMAAGGHRGKHRTHRGPHTRLRTSTTGARKAAGCVRYGPS
jgi:hypothetical protein